MRSASLEQRRWVAQWQAAGPALARVREQELARLSHSDALAAADALLSIGAEMPIPAHRLAWSGLIELQQLLRGALK